MSDVEKTIETVEKVADAAVSVADKLTAAYRELCAVYGDAQYRMKDLAKFVAETETKIAALHAEFQKSQAAPK